MSTYPPSADILCVCDFARFMTNSSVNRSGVQTLPLWAQVSGKPFDVAELGFLLSK